MARKLCDVCGVRPAVVTVRRVVPGEPPRIENLCEVHAAQARGGRSPLGGGSLFDDFFNRFVDAPGEPTGAPERRTAPAGRRAEQVDITQFFSDSTSELLQRAARQASEWGSLDLNTEHLLYSALEDVDITVHDRVLTVSGERKVEEETERGGYYVRERRHGTFRRSMTLPEGVDEESIKARFEDGVLEVTIEGAAAVREPKRIQIEGSSDEGESTEGEASGR